jgi:hypothetical protein
MSYNTIPILELMQDGGATGEYSDYIYIALFVIIGIILYQFYLNYHNLAEMLNKRSEQPQIDPQKNISVNIIKEPPPPIQQSPIINPLREYDYRTLLDPLVAPRRRDDYNLPVLPIPTRGFPAPYKKMGLLIDKNAHTNDVYKILLLFGRNTHPNSSSYEYYAIKDISSPIKFDIKKTRELNTDDVVVIEQLGKPYTVILDKTLGYDYDPYLY